MFHVGKLEGGETRKKQQQQQQNKVKGIAFSVYYIHMNVI